MCCMEQNNPIPLVDGMKDICTYHVPYEFLYDSHKIVMVKEICILFKRQIFLF